MKRKKILKQEFDTLNIRYRAFKTNKGSRFVYTVPESVLKRREEERRKLLEAEKLIGEAEQEVVKQTTGKKKTLNLLFFLLNIVVVVFVLIYQIKQEGVIPLEQLLAYNLNGWFLVLAVLFFALMMFLKSLRINILIKRSSKRSRPFLSYKTSALGRYYESITPMAAGGQPYQVFYLSKRGLNASSALSVPLGKFFLSETAWVLMNAFAVIYALANGNIASKIVLVLSVVNFLINTVALAGIFILSINKKFGSMVVGKTFKLLKKMKLIKDYDKQYNKVMKTVEDYQDSIKAYGKNKKTFVFQFLLSIFIYFINYTILFFIYSALKEYDTSLYFDIIVKALIVDIAAGMIPLPGGTGVSEVSFTAVFASLFTDGTMFWGLLLWRLMNYYSYIIQGISIVIYDFAVGNKKYYWQKKKWELENESAEFRRQQLAAYKRKKMKNRNRRIV